MSGFPHFCVVVELGVDWYTGSQKAPPNQLALTRNTPPFLLHEPYAMHIHSAAYAMA